MFVMRVQCVRVCFLVERALFLARDRVVMFICAMLSRSLFDCVSHLALRSCGCRWSSANCPHASMLEVAVGDVCFIRGCIAKYWPLASCAELLQRLELEGQFRKEWDSVQAGVAKCKGVLVSSTLVKQCRPAGPLTCEAPPLLQGNTVMV